MKPRRRPREVASKIWFTVLAWSCALVIGFPLYWMMASALKPGGEIVQVPQTFYPHDPSLDNFRQLGEAGVPRWFANSMFVSLVTVGIVVVLSSLGAYSMTRFRYPGRQTASLLILLAYLLPSTLIIVPVFLIINQLRFGNSYAGLILANLTFALPFSLWLLRGYFSGVTVQVEHAALIDGASRVRAFVDVVVPQIIPGVVSAAIFVFITSWNQYLFALVFISDSDRFTMPIGIAQFSKAIDAEWGPLMAASVVSTLPILAIFVVLQKRFLANFGLEGGRR